MKSLSKSIRRIAGACFAALWCTSPVWGDDTEIFFGDVSTTDIRPNVLFIIDTSGSMGSGVSGAPGDRLDNVKEAFYTLMDELANVNVGLMRFTNPGGPILYPVTYIDEVIEEDPNITLDVPVATSSDDAQEVISSGLMSLDGSFVSMSMLPDVTLETFYDQVAAGGDDSAQYYSTIYINYDGTMWFDGIETNGFAFTGSDIPSGAKITNAYLRFTGQRGDSGTVNYTIYGEPGNPAAFSSASNDLTSRTYSTASVDWTITQAVADGETIDTPSLVTIVQELVDDPAWNPDGGGADDMVFILTPNGSSPGDRYFYGYEGSPTQAAQLFVEYYLPSASSGVAQETRTGLRFDAVDLPRGATISNAQLSFTADRDFSETFDLTISVEETGDASTFSSTAGDIAGRTTSATTVAWAGALSGSNGDTFQSPDLAAMVNAISNRSDWCGGNALSFIIEGPSGALPAWAVDGDPSLAPRLQLTYDYDSIPVGSSCLRRTTSTTVSASSDDAEETSSAANTTSGDLDIYSGSDVGIRFANIPVPKNAVVFESYIELTSDSGDDPGVTTMVISAESSDDALTYTGTTGTITGRTYSGSTVTWTTDSAAWATGETYRSPDISSLVSGVTSRAGWSAGNAMAFKISSTSSDDKEAETYDGSPGEAPRLVVVFQDDGSGLTDRTTRDVMTELVSELNHQGWTPIQDTLYEAALYYTGESVKWGASRGSSSVDGGPFAYTRVSADASMVDGTYTVNRPTGCTDANLGAPECANETISGNVGTATYDSPIDDSCQEQSHIILLTDGAANRPHSASLIPTFTGAACANVPTDNGDGTTTALTSGEQCVKDLAEYMNQNDMRPLLDRNQRITTHTIGFNFSSQWLEDVANAGGGTYTTANNASDLVDEIKDIIGEVLTEDSTFVAPVAAVNEFNQLSHLSQVYFAVFRPDELPRWRGNLKRYSLSDDGAQIVDVNGNLAIDSSTGFFQTGAQSFWSSGVDGANVDVGGAAENTPSNTSRNLYTYYTGSSSTNLANSVNALVSTNTDLTKNMFDVSSMTVAEFTDHINWIRGQDVDDEDIDGNTTEDRYVYGDPLHSRPVAVTYGGTEDNPDVEIFFGTNAGTLQAIDADTGAETFAFMPESLLPMQLDLRNNLATTSHPYGLDGTITTWTNDEDRDDIDPAHAGDFVRVYTGMRRGGRNYYALDATDRANPELMWQIEGGNVQANGDDFRELGQTWSRPVKTQIILSGDTAPRDVLLFSAGYDELQDEAQMRASDSVGRGMYIVDAVSGRLLWSGGKSGAQSWTESYSEMDYSFPSTPSAIDINLDGLADMWFVADTGGRVWRFDIANGETLSNLVTGGVIADLGVANGSNSIATNRRFFASPSVALVRGPDGPELAVAIGSGFRPSPLSVLATNRMYMIRQQAVFSAPSSYTALLEGDLYDATANTLATAEGTLLASEQDLLYAAQGWFIDLQNTGEKVISSPLIARDRVVFTTYTPGTSGSACQPAAGSSLAYSVRLEDAVRTEPPIPLFTVGLVDDPTIVVPPSKEPDSNDPDDGNDPDDPNDDGGACPNGNQLVIKLNAEDGPIDDWCNDASKTYWLREQ
ncbi:MAG: hypothetical protein AAGG55_14540 [Pseudomonadota bacterium]